MVGCENIRTKRQSKNYAVHFLECIAFHSFSLTLFITEIQRTNDEGSGVSSGSYQKFKEDFIQNKIYLYLR